MRRTRFGEDGYQVGQFLRVYERVKDQLNKRSEAGHNLRVTVGNKFVELTPDYDNDNINPGTATGAVVAAIAETTDEFIPVDILSETEIADVEPTSDGAIYTVNVDAPLPQQARFQAMMEAGTGFTSLVADEFDVSEPELLRKRPGRDTYQYTVKVKEVGADGDGLGLDVLDAFDDPEL
jgi:hypothetical protein